MPIRICHIITGLNTGGAERMLLKLLSGMDRRRFETLVVSLLDRGTLGDDIEALGIPLTTLNLPRGLPHPAGLANLARTVRRFRPRIVQGWMYHGNLAALLAARLAPERPAVLWNVRHSLYALDHEKPLTRRLIRLAVPLSGMPRAIVYNSATSAGQHERLGFRADRRVLLPNGFDCAAFAPDPEARARWREAHGYADGTPVIGLAARYHPMKDHGNFLKAAQILAARRNDVRFVLAGTGTDESNGELATLIGELGLGDRVRLLGETRDMPALFRGLDIAALASAWGEAFPNVLGEAMASGLPCAATDVGDAAGIVGDTGRIVPPRDPAALAGAFKELIELGPEGRARLGERARFRVLARYALPEIVARYEDLYSRVASGEWRVGSEE
jgi:glycosyltransferase involved in cell wall biosynthesis